jgi:hypothetical protein
MENWFKHDSTAHADAKLMQLLMQDKRYYANYFLTLEWLFLMDDATASDKEFNGLAYFLHESKEDTNTFIDFCLDLDLFIKEDNIFYSPRLKDQKEKQNEKSATAREKANKRWSKNNAKPMPQHSNSNATAMQNRIEENRIEENRIVTSVTSAKQNDFLIAKKLFAMLYNNNPAFNQKYKDLTAGEKTCWTWAVDIERLVRIDGATYEQIGFVIEWINSKDGEFWQSNIMSGRKLREKFTTIVGQMKRKPKTYGRETTVINF